MNAQREIKKDPKRAVEVLEKILEKEPYHRQANLVLKDAAVTAGWPEIGVFALRTLLEENPRDVKVLHELGRLHHELRSEERRVGKECRARWWPTGEKTSIGRIATRAV